MVGLGLGLAAEAEKYHGVTSRRGGGHSFHTISQISRVNFMNMEKVASVPESACNVSNS